MKILIRPIFQLKFLNYEKTSNFFDPRMVHAFFTFTVVHMGLNFFLIRLKLKRRTVLGDN